MSKFRSSFRQFVSAREGSLIPIYALTALVVMLIVGLTVDFKRFDNAKSRMQDAADAAVLAAAREYLNLNVSNMTETERQTAAIAVGEAYFLANISVDETMIDNLGVDIKFTGETGEVTAKATGDVQMVFGGFAGLDTQDVAARSAAAAGDPRRLEVVLALDNSVSMFFDDRMSLLRDASKEFVDIVFEGSMGPNTVQIGVVPWASSVNILSEEPKPWDPTETTTVSPTPTPSSTPKADNGGSKKTPAAPYDDRLNYLYEAGGYSGGYTASELADAFAPVGWRGCIGAAKFERKVDKNGEVTTDLDDDPPNPMKWPALLNQPAVMEKYVVTGGGSQQSGGCKDYDFNDLQPGGKCSTINYEAPKTEQCKGSGCNIPNCSQKFNDTYSFIYNAYLPADQVCTSSGGSVETDTLPTCVSDPNEHAWWNADSTRTACPGITLSDWESEDDISDKMAGPNLTCPSAMLPLSQSRPQLYEKLEHIFPVWEGTQADVGLMWALRMLSDHDDWVNFWGYSEDSSPLAFDDRTRVRKMVVLLSDGNNEFPNWGDGYYGCAQNRTPYGRDNCLQAKGVDSLTPEALDNLMIDACDALKDKDVEVYTIALDLDSKDKDEKEAIKLLKDCATDSDHAYNISSSELEDTFTDLAQHALRLTK